MTSNGKKTLYGGGLGTLALIVWGMLFWGLLADQIGVFKSPTVDPGVVAALADAGTQTGTYFYPWPRNTAEAAEAWRSAHTDGPFFRLSYVREGADPQSPGKLALGTLHNLVVAMLASGLLVLAGANRPFGASFALVFFAGVMGTVMTVLGDPVWFHMPTDYAIGNALYEIGAWILLASVLAWSHRPRSLA